MNKLAALLRVLDGFTEKTGAAAAWSAVLMVLLTCFIVVTRKWFNIGSIAVQEALIYLNAILFMLCAGYTLKHDAHVRVDIIYGSASPRYKAWTNLLGTVFLLVPVMLSIAWFSWDYVAAAWRIKEGSGESGGLPLVYLLKSLILVMVTLLLIQGLAEILRNCLVLARATNLISDKENHQTETVSDSGAQL